MEGRVAARQEGYVAEDGGEGRLAGETSARRWVS